MTALLAVAGFALLFALVAVIPLKTGGGGCGGGSCHGCEGDECELDAGISRERRPDLGVRTFDPDARPSRNGRNGRRGVTEP